MLIKEKTGRLSDFINHNRAVDYVLLEWYECSKRILHKKTNGGIDLVIKFLKEAQQLQQDDVLYADDNLVIAVEINPCEAIIIKPASMNEMAAVCYEIGNKHLPLFYEDGELLMPHDTPTHRMLQAAGFKPFVEMRKLCNQMRTTVLPHLHSQGQSLFSKILKLTASE